MADPMRKEVNWVRKKIDSVNKELKPLGSTVQKKVNTLFKSSCFIRLPDKICLTTGCYKKFWSLPNPNLNVN